jgi:acetyl esterase/lipase
MGIAKWLAALAWGALYSMGVAAANGTEPAAPGPAASAVHTSGSGQPEARPSAEVFYREVDIADARLSPSGRWLAIGTLAGAQRVGLVVFDLQLWKPMALVARFADADIGDFRWVNDDRLVFSVRDLGRGGGEQRWWPGLFSAKRDGTELRQLVKVSNEFIVGNRSFGREPLEARHELLHIPDGGGDEVIVGEWLFGAAGEPHGVVAKRLNVVTGLARSISAGTPEHVRAWWFDRHGVPRVLHAQHDGRVTLHWKGRNDSAWRVLAEFDALQPAFSPAYVDDADGLYVTAVEHPAGVRVLKRFDFKRGAPAEEALVRSPGFDFTGSLVADAAGSQALGVRVVTDAETTVWFDPTMQAVQAQADARLPGHVNRIICRRCGQPDMVALVQSWSDRDPGQLWVHHAATGQWRKVGDLRAKVEPRRMARTDFARFRARDGLEVPVWVTLPPGPAKPRATVMLVHGGPWVRGRHWRWSADAQFLASRGYAVVEPEFRGSTGYGQALYRAGWRQWGQAMQDDVADALAWAVKQGHSDPARVCIAGASYGGYATLMGLVRHPDLYKCGVAWVAVTDPRLMFTWRHDSDLSDESRSYYFPGLIGDPVKDAAMIDSVTPVLHAHRIQAPLLLAFGGQDRRVPLVHGTRLRDALRSAGKEPEWVVYPDEGHGWFKLDNRLDFARRMEAFLAQHLPP